jgi:hypothetical protein
MKLAVVAVCLGSIVFASEFLPVVKYDPFAKANAIMQHKKTTYTHKYRGKKLQLVAIWNDMASINGKLYKKNDWVGGYKIVKITKEKVFLRHGHKKIVLSLGSSDFLQMK